MSTLPRNFQIMQRHLVKIFPFIIICLCFSGCGLKPFYSIESFPSSTELRTVSPEPMNSIFGAEYYERIHQLLAPEAPAKYKLKTHFSYSSSFSVILQNSDVVRDRITLVTSYSLYDISSGKILDSGKFSRSLSYSTTFAPYSNTVLQHDTSVKLARYAAEEVHNRLVMYFANRREERTE